MALKAELRALQWQGSVAEFRELLRRNFKSLFPDNTLDGVLCDPPSALRFCGAVCADMRIAADDNFVLNEALNARKAKQWLRHDRQRDRQLLKTELLEHGWTESAERFRELLDLVFAEMFRNLTPDGLIVRPSHALRYCETVRLKSALPLPAEIILRPMLNIRKARKPRL